MDSISPVFSIIIPTYNRGHLLSATLNSVLSQKFENFEVIIIDDGGTDETEKLIKELDDDRLKYFWKENGERGAARNFGIAQSEGKYITFLDSDDLLFPHHLEVANTTISTHPDILIFRQAFEIWDDANNKVKSNSIIKGETVNKSLIEGNALACLGVFLKKHIAEKYQFDPTYTFAGTEDYELWVRIANDLKIKNSMEITARLIDHPQRSVNNQKKVDNLIFRIQYLIDSIGKKTNKLENWPDKPWRTFLSFRYSYIALHAAIEGLKMISVNFLIKSLLTRPAFFFTKRNLVIIKILIFN